MSGEDVTRWLEELRENWDDPYWRADHPEVLAVILAFLTGIIGLVFAVAQTFIQRRLMPDA